VSSILDFLKVKNYALHSKMQQKQRLKALDRFKAAVQKIEGDRAVELGDNKTPNANTIDGNRDGAILVCTDVASRGLDIPNVQNVIHYQSPFNAEIYVHRCGRTARIGRSGETLALLAPQDERNFKTLCAVLKKDVGAITMLDVKYQHLEMLKSVVKSATDLEKQDHRKHADEKAASWLLKQAKEAEIDLDDDLRHEVQAKLAGSKRTRKASDQDFDEPIDQPLFKVFDDQKFKERNRAVQREQALKEGYEKTRKAAMVKQFSKSSFLTPEAAMYLNDALKANRKQVDQEIVYAGLHSDKVSQIKFKRKEKNK